MDDEGFDLKKLVFSKINRKLTVLFVIVALIAPILGIYYFYIIANSTLSEALFADQGDLIRIVAIAIIVIIAVDAGFVGFFVSRSISKPIKKLYMATEEVEKGNYDIRIDINTNDEIEELGKAFNRMAEELSRYHAALEESKIVLRIKVSSTSSFPLYIDNPIFSGDSVLYEETYNKFHVALLSSLKYHLAPVENTSNFNQ